MTMIETVIEWRDGSIEKPCPGQLCVVAHGGVIGTLKCWAGNAPGTPPQFEVGYGDPESARWWASLPRDLPEDWDDDDDGASCDSPMVPDREGG